MLNNSGSRSTRGFLSEDLDRMLLYNISWSADDFISEEPGQMLLYNTGSWSAGDFLPEEPGHHVFI